MSHECIVEQNHNLTSMGLVIWQMKAVFCFLLLSIIALILNVVVVFSLDNISLRLMPMSMHTLFVHIYWS